MATDRKTEKNKRREESEDPKKEKKSEDDIDEEVEQTFPASDPPSYSNPGNDKKAD